MIVLISLQYTINGEDRILDVWNIRAPSVAAVQHLVNEELGPALRRHGRRYALSYGVRPSEYRPQMLLIEIEESPLYSLDEMCREINDEHGPRLRAHHRNWSRMPPTGIARIPDSPAAVLTKHGVIGPSGKRTRYRLRGEKLRPPLPDDDDPPF